MVYRPLCILSLALAPSHAVVIQQAIREHDAPKEANVPAGLDQAEEDLEGEDLERAEVIVQGYNRKDWEEHGNPSSKNPRFGKHKGAHPKGSHPLFGNPKEDQAKQANKVAEAAKAQAEQATLDEQTAIDAYNALPWYEKEAMQAREATLIQPQAKNAARRSAKTKPTHPGDPLNDYEKRFLYPRCNALELTRIHRSLATDLSQFFGNNADGGIRFPDTTVKGEWPNCTQRNLVPRGGLNSEAYAMCFSARSHIGVHCHSCFDEFAYKALNWNGGRVQGKNKVPVGCYPNCAKSLAECEKSLKDVTALGSCFDNPDLKKCFNCLMDPLDKLADCIGDKTPHNPTTFAMMLVNAMEEDKPASIGVLQFIKGLAIQALMEEHTMKARNTTTDPHAREADPSMAPNVVEEVLKEELEKRKNEKEEEAHADDLFR